MEELWSWYLTLDTSVQIGIWIATVATITFLINFICIPIYKFINRKFLNPNSIHKNEVIEKLHDFVKQADEIDRKVQNKKLSINDAEFKLIQWKIQVIRYLEMYIGVAEAEGFLNMRTNVGSGLDLKHYKSSFQNHIKYIETIISRVKENPQSKLIINNHKLSLGKVKFIYR